MTIRQRVLKAIYPLFRHNREQKIKGNPLVNQDLIRPPVSFYNLSATLNNSETLSFSDLKGKSVLLVNTASDCGYTAQYQELQELYEKCSEILTIIAFPSNDFKQQEKGSDEEIAEFCKGNYGITFPLAKKSHVTGANQNQVYQWLSNKQQNGWCDHEPDWNFSKYLVNGDGILTHYFHPSISPLSNTVTKAITNKQ